MDHSFRGDGEWKDIVRIVRKTLARYTFVRDSCLVSREPKLHRTGVEYGNQEIVPQKLEPHRRFSRRHEARVEVKDGQDHAQDSRPKGISP